MVARSARSLSPRSIFLSTSGTRLTEAGGLGPRLTLGIFAGFGSLLGPRTRSRLAHSNAMTALWSSAAPVAFAARLVESDDLIECLQPGEPQIRSARMDADDVRNSFDDVCDKSALVALRFDHRS